MLVAISGTPGVGKSSTSKELKKLRKINIISLSSLLVKYKIPYTYDKKRKTRAVSIQNLKKAVKKSLKKGNINIIDGHLSHFLGADIVIILRCRPDILEKRMKKKGWGRSKIKENLEVEILDSTTIEALENSKKDNIFEIDTTGKKPKQVATIINQVLNNYSRQGKYKVGKIDWSKRFAKYLIKKE